MHTIEELRGGVHDFCSVLDQSALCFVWEWVISVQIPRERLDLPIAEVVRNGTIEASLLAIRTVDEFFLPLGRNTDIRSHHYDGFVSGGGFLTGEERSRINTRIAHLTVDRAVNPQSIWKIAELTKRTYRASKLFLDYGVHGPGAKFQPKNGFDVHSRLLTCERIDAWIDGVIGKQESQFREDG